MLICAIRVALLLAGVAAASPLAPGSATAAPTAEEIVHRVLNANAQTPDVVAADTLFKFRIHRPVTAPPDCMFEGTLHLEQGRQAVEISRQTFGLTCWVVNRFLIGRFFEGREPVETFLSRFAFVVLGEKVVGGTHYYLVQGRAQAARTNPRGLIGWIDYDRGLVTDGSVEYAWGTLETEQRYTQIAGAWVLSYQFLEVPRFDASMEVFYSHFQFARR